MAIKIVSLASPNHIGIAVMGGETMCTPQESKVLLLERNR